MRRRPSTRCSPFPATPRDGGGHSPPMRPGYPLRLRRLGGRGSVRGSPCGEPARLRSGLQGSIPSDPGIRGPLHPPRLRSPPSSYRSGYASVGRLAGGGASTLSVHGLFGNGTLEAGLTVPPVLPTAGVPQGSVVRPGVGRPPPAAAPPDPPASCPPFVLMEGTPGSVFHTGVGPALRRGPVSRIRH